MVLLSGTEVRGRHAGGVADLRCERPGFDLRVIAERVGWGVAACRRHLRTERAVEGCVSVDAFGDDPLWTLERRWSGEQNRDPT